MQVCATSSSPGGGKEGQGKLQERPVQDQQVVPPSPWPLCDNKS